MHRRSVQCSLLGVLFTGNWMKTIYHKIFAFIPCLYLAAVLANADEVQTVRPVRKPVVLPGLVVDFEKRCVDLEAKVCLDAGYLELVACTEGSKEHESIVAVTARPMHIHTALLLLGANNGNPAMRKQVGKKEKRWVNVPPRGDAIKAYLVLKDPDGKMLERPIRDFIKRSGEKPGDLDADSHKSDAPNFPDTFLFAGSHLRDAKKGPREYLADSSGNVISIVTFGDELLCLPGLQSHANGALSWEVDPTHLPAVGTMVTLRLRPEKKQTTGVKK